MINWQNLVFHFRQQKSTEQKELINVSIVINKKDVLSVKFLSFW